MPDLRDMEEEDYLAWLAKVGASADPLAPTDENMVVLFSEMIREQQPQARARLLLELINMSHAAIDVALGAPVTPHVSLRLAKNQHIDVVDGIVKH